MIAGKDVPLGVWNYPCPSCHVRRGFKCDSGGRATEDVHLARLRAYRGDPTWTVEAEAADHYEGSRLADVEAELERVREAAAELALRIADVAEIATSANFDEDALTLNEDAGAFLSALDYALRGSGGCIEPDEWQAAREAALAKHGEYLDVPRAALSSTGGVPEEGTDDV